MKIAERKPAKVNTKAVHDYLDHLKSIVDEEEVEGILVVRFRRDGSYCSGHAFAVRREDTYLLGALENLKHDLLLVMHRDSQIFDL